MEPQREQLIDSQHSNLLGNNEAVPTEAIFDFEAHQEEQNSLRNRTIRVFIALSVILFFFWFSSAIRSAPEKQDPFVSKATSTKAKLPRIFWIYTENERDAEPMESDIYVNYLEAIAKKQYYEVRVVNSWSAYDWLSNSTIEKITKTMQNNRIDEPIHNILKLALLADNGGVMANWGTFFTANNFGFLAEMFDELKGKPTFKYVCQRDQAQLFMPQRSHQLFGISFSSSLIAAIPNSKILRQAFDILTEIMISEKVPFDEKLHLLSWNEDTRVHYLPKSLESAVNLAVFKHHQQGRLKEKNDICKLGLQQAITQIQLSLEGQTEYWNRIVLTKQERHSNRLLQLKGIKNRRTIQVITDISSSSTFMYLEQLIMDRKQPGQVPRESTIYKILSESRNKEIFLEPLLEKEVEICLVVMDSLTKSEINQTSVAFDQQTYQNWTLILPAIDLTGIPNISNEKVKIMQGLTNQVHNTEKAVARHCPHRSYAVILNKGERFNSIMALQEIAKAVFPRNTAGLFISLNIDGCLKPPKKRWTFFNRVQGGIVSPHYEAMNKILNHFRIFSVQSFKQIPKFIMVNMFGKYFEDRIIFLMELLDFVYQDFKYPQHHFLRKKFDYIWELPLRVDILTIDISLVAKEMEQVNKEQVKMTRTRLSGLSVQKQIESIISYKIPFTKLVAFNNGEDFVPVQEKKGPDLIPKVIHQAWLGGKLPPAKQYFYDKTKKMYPAYEVKLWQEQNITKEAFPNTYDVIQNIIRFNKHSPYNKLATVTDILRHEVLYHQGGFWKDAGMNFLRPIFDKFLKYKLVIPVDRVGRYRWLQGMCFFANMPKYQNLLRINNYKNLNRMRIYIVNAFNIAGPVDFRQLLIREEQYDPNVLTLPYQTFYPGQITQHPQNDICTKRFYQMKKDEEYVMYENGWYVVSNCDELYPHAYAIEHNRFGDSWYTRKG